MKFTDKVHKFQNKNILIMESGNNCEITFFSKTNFDNGVEHSRVFQFSLSQWL